MRSLRRGQGWRRAGHAIAVAVLLALAFLAPSVVLGDEDTHHYKDAEVVNLWQNKIGPYHNPQETYRFDKMPLCFPAPNKALQQTKSGGIGEVLEGHDLINSNTLIQFKTNVRKAKLCTMRLTRKEDVIALRHAVARHYWFQLYLDDLPVWGMLGEVSATAPELKRLNDGDIYDTDYEAYIFTERRFSIAYNGDQIIEVNLTSAEPRLVIPDKSHDLTYSVEWVETSKPFERRFERYLDYSFFEHHIHWFSIFNSFMMVIFLCGLVALILHRTLRSDLDKYERLTQDEAEGYAAEEAMADAASQVEDSGWKNVHAEVFRTPRHLALLAALLGSGWQLMLLLLSVILLAIAGTLYIERGAVVQALVGCYALTSFAGGYASGKFYKGEVLRAPNLFGRKTKNRRNGGGGGGGGSSDGGGRRSAGFGSGLLCHDGQDNWKGAMLLTALLVPGVVVGIGFPLNLLAWSHDTIHAMPFPAMVKIALLWLFLSFPLTIAGSLVGRVTVTPQSAAAPKRVSLIPRAIPDRPVYAHPAVLVMLTGLLPFGSIFIEMYFIFTSFWNYKFYYVYGFMLLVLCILVIVTVCVTIVSTYFLLNAEDYRWQWMSFLSSASTAVYVFLYSIYFFMVKTNMHGALQTSYFFGYTAILCCMIAIVTGTTGFIGARAFVTAIYGPLKVD